MATPLDALSFREMFGRQLRLRQRGQDQAYVVTPFTDDMTPTEMANAIEVVRHSLIRTVDHGDVHYVSADMTMFLQRMVEAYLKDRTLFHFDVGDFPSLTGFVYFDGPIRLPTIYSPTGYQDLRAVLWDQFAYGGRPGGSDRLMGAGDPQLYFGGAEGAEHMEVVGKILYTVCDTPNQEQRERYGPWKMRHWLPFRYSQRFSAETLRFDNASIPGLNDQERQEDRASMEQAMHLVVRTLLAWTRVIKTEIPVLHPKPESYDKVMRKEGRPPADVKVTLLRRYARTEPH